MSCSLALLPTTRPQQTTLGGSSCCLHPMAFPRVSGNLLFWFLACGGSPRPLPSLSLCRFRSLWVSASSNCGGVTGLIDSNSCVTKPAFALMDMHKVILPIARPNSGPGPERDFSPMTEDRWPVNTREDHFLPVRMLSSKRKNKTQAESSTGW